MVKKSANAIKAVSYLAYRLKEQTLAKHETGYIQFQLPNAVHKKREEQKLRNARP
jgi:hypothetical protein